MRTKKILLSLLLSGLCLTVTQAQEFWFPNTPKDPNTTILRPGRTGIGIPTTSFNAFNTSTGRYTVADQVGFLVQGSNFTDVFNIGHLLTGDYGEEKVGDVWTAIGGPGNPNIAGLPLYGTRHQFDRYSVNMALTDRNIITGASGTSGIRDAIMFWDASPANNSRMYIGKTLGQGRISPDIVIDPNGNVGIGTDAPTSKFQVQGGDIRLDQGRAIRFGSNTNISTNNNALTLSVGGGIVPRRFTFASNGRVGIGTTAPTATLDVRGDIGLGQGNEIRFGPNARILNLSGGNLEIENSGILTIDSDVLVSIQSDVGFGGTINSPLIPTTLGFPTQDLGSSSNAWDDVFGDNFINVSDQREKDKIEQLPYGLNHLMKLNPVCYQWKKQPEKGIKHGLIAQEVQKVIPEVVYDPEQEIDYDEAGKALPVDPEARMGIAYSELIPLLIKSIQELNTKVQEQEKIIAGLTDENGRTSADELEESLDSPGGSSKLELLQNTPNPFDQSTTIRYYLPEGTQKAQLFIYNIDGQQVRSMELTETGEGAMTITAGELGAGIYFYTLYADGEVSQTRKMILTE